MIALLRQVSALDAPVLSLRLVPRRPPPPKGSTLADVEKAGTPYRVELIPV